MNSIGCSDDELKELILINVSDCVGDLLYYNRKEDEDLPRGVIEDAVKEGVLSVDDMLKEFKKVLERSCLNTK